MPMQSRAEVPIAAIAFNDCLRNRSRFRGDDLLNLLLPQTSAVAGTTPADHVARHLERWRGVAAEQVNPSISELFAFQRIFVAGFGRG